MFGKHLHQPSTQGRQLERTRRAALSASSVILLVGVALASANVGAAVPAGWSEPALVESNLPRSAITPQVAVDPSGNAVAVWVDAEATGWNIWANRFVSGIGWGTPEIIDAGDAYGSTSVGVDASGNAVAVWTQYSGTGSVWANHYTVGSGWGSAARIEAIDGRESREVQVAVGPKGHAVAAWIQDNGSYQTLAWVNRFVPGEGWGGPELLQPAVTLGSPGHVRIAVDGSGDAMVVWHGPTASGYAIMAKQFVGRAWLASEMVRTPSWSEEAWNPDLAVNANGQAVVVWAQTDGTRFNTWANGFVPDRGWGTAELIEADDSGQARDPQVGIDAVGNAVAVWFQSDGATNFVFANRFTDGQGWGRAVAIDRDNALGAWFPQVYVDPNGDATAVWYQDDATGANIWTNGLLKDRDWGTAALLETRNVGSAVAVVISGDGRGNAFAIWMQYDGMVSRIWASQFTAPDRLPPAVFLSSPASGVSTNASSQWVAGLAEPGATVSVNGYAAAVAADGTFGLLIPLQAGSNTIVATAQDDAGNAASASVMVTFVDPLPGVAQQLAAAQADLSAAQRQVLVLEARADAAQAALSVAQDNLTAAQARADSIAADANATQGELEGARSDLAAAQTRLAEVEGDLVALHTELSSNQAELGAARSDFNSTQVQGAAPSADSSMGTILGLLGIGIGALAVGLAVRNGRAKPGTAPPPAPPLDRPQ